MNPDLPDGWVIAPLARDRLAYQARRLSGATAVVAPLVPLPPGTSYRTLAEHLALLPLDALHRVEDDPQGTAVDRGTACHDPEGVAPELLAASPLGRSPFPRRPLAVLLTFLTDDEHLDRARQTANGLIELGIEARLAVRRFPVGAHLARPCTAEQVSLVTLRPDAVIALDREALDVAAPWSAPFRRTTVIDATGDATAGPEQPVHVDLGGGRQRASVPPDIGVDALAGLVRRLAVGPQPGPPPVDTPVQPSTRVARRQTGTPRPATLHRIVLRTGILDHDAHLRALAVADALAATGHEVTVSDGQGDDRELIDSHLLIAAGVVAEPRLLDIVDRRRAAGRATVVDLTAADLAPDRAEDRHPDDQRGGPFGLAPHVRPLVEAAGLATSSSEAWCDELRRAGVQAHLLPTPTGDLVPGPLRPDRQVRDRLAWVISDDASEPAVRAAVADLLERYPDLLVGIWADPRHWPHDIADHPRISTLVGAPDPGDLSDTAAFLWAPDHRWAEATGAPRWFSAAIAAGACPIVPAPGPDTLRPFIPSTLLVHAPDDPGAWSTVAATLLDDDTALGTHRREVHRRAVGAEDAVALRRRMADLVGWATSRRPPR